MVEKTNLVEFNYRSRKEYLLILLIIFTWKLNTNNGQSTLWPLIYYIMIKGCDVFRTNLPHNKGCCLWLGCLANIVKQFRAYIVIQSKIMCYVNIIAVFIILVVVGLSLTP